MTSKLPVNVYQAAMKRIAYIFNEFDNVCIAFSGGKDSGVLLNLVVEYAKTHNLKHKLGVFHLDYEAQYTATTEYVDQVYQELGDDVVNLRCCVPVKVTTCTSMTEDHWRPWEQKKKHLWVREKPENALDKDAFDFIKNNTTDYEFSKKFSSWYHKKTKAKKTAVIIGIRADESLDRWRTIVSDRNINKYNGMPWTTKVDDDIYNAYPIYDWVTDDVWIANAKKNWSYNKLYDLFHYAGIPPHAMRVASPFLSEGKSSLKLYKTLDPLVWGKMVSRVNGVNFTALYGGTTAMGWRKIEKPNHFTWQQYAEFLLKTLPADTSDNFRAKLATSIKFWQQKGGVLGQDAISDLTSAGIVFKVGLQTNYKTDKKPVTMNYIDEIDSKDFTLIPTWKRLCITILKNDHVGKYMGFSQTKNETAKRKAAIEKYKDL
ncbi:MAG: putative phosphoadenosine phosphosulfate sulfurtransferase [Cocleimonas sp.]|jgi:predicted phosphoadenosine phosphosulfate sulfurtransferase